MDVVGSEIGQKMRSAIKAKLTELGCYVDDELPDYVMVMVANKRTRAQMEDDLQLFLGDNTVQFVNWLHQVLRKLQEVTVTTPAVSKKPENPEKVQKVRSASKEKKIKEKKEKHKKSDAKKSKKKSKAKGQKKEKKAHKKKKSKDKQPEVINRPNVPPLLMNMEKESEPSITDVFAGQILKNHGITIDTPKEEFTIEKKPVVTELKRPIVPIIDLATIQPDQPATETNEISSQPEHNEEETRTAGPRDEQLKEISEIESKIQGLRQKLAEQLDSMSDDEDFLNIRTEAEELMTDFADDVFQEISATKPPSTDTPPLQPTSQELPPTPQKLPPTPQILPPTVSTNTESIPQPPKESETLPQIELNLPKRPVRERLGARQENKKSTDQHKKVEKKSESKKVEKEKRVSPERFTAEKEPDFWGKSAKSRLGDPVLENKKRDRERKSSFSDDSNSEQPEAASKRERITSKVSVLERVEPRPRSGPASVVRVRPRPRPGPAPLLLRAVADAHRSLLNIPPKKEIDSPKIQRALVMPMRRGVAEAQKIVIQVAQDRPADRRNRSVSPARDPSDCEIDFDTESLADLDSDPENRSSKASANSSKNDIEYVPTSITKKILNTNYVPSRRSTKVDETLIVETINNHKTGKEKDKGPTFVVTLDGLDTNIFLAKKLKTEGLLDEETEITRKIVENPKKDLEKVQEKTAGKIVPSTLEKKRLSDTSEESDTQVIIQASETNVAAKRKTVEDLPEKRRSVEDPQEGSPPPVKKRRASPIVFDVEKKEKEVVKERETDRVRERTESAGSDNHVTVTTNASSHKYDSLPSLSVSERKLLPCRAFPLCRFGAACAFSHPACKFAAACTRRSCVYSHPPAHANAPPLVASHVVPAANFKTISPTVIQNLCKYYPNCANPSCHFYHPKPCRYGRTCTNKLECNFYHHELQPSNKWRVA